MFIWAPLARRAKRTTLSKALLYFLSVQLLLFIPTAYAQLRTEPHAYYARVYGGPALSVFNQLDEEWDTLAITMQSLTSSVALPITKPTISVGEDADGYIYTLSVAPEDYLLTTTHTVQPEMTDGTAEPPVTYTYALRISPWSDDLSSEVLSPEVLSSGASSSEALSSEAFSSAALSSAALSSAALSSDALSSAALTSEISPSAALSPDPATIDYVLGITPAYVYYRDAHVALAIPTDKLPGWVLQERDYYELFNYLALYNGYFTRMLLPMVLLMLTAYLIGQAVFYWAAAWLFGQTRKITTYMRFSERFIVCVFASLVAALPGVLLGFVAPVVHILLFEVAVVYVAYKIMREY